MELQWVVERVQTSQNDLEEDGRKLTRRMPPEDQNGSGRKKRCREKLTLFGGRRKREDFERSRHRLNPCSRFARVQSIDSGKPDR
jgi:hypothetical protein